MGQAKAGVMATRIGSYETHPDASDRRGQIAITAALSGLQNGSSVPIHGEAIEGGAEQLGAVWDKIDIAWEAGESDADLVRTVVDVATLCDRMLKTGGALSGTTKPVYAVAPKDKVEWFAHTAERFDTEPPSDEVGYSVKEVYRKGNFVIQALQNGMVVVPGLELGRDIEPSAEAGLVQLTSLLSQSSEGQAQETLGHNL
jgi:hypothetical protein